MEMFDYLSAANAFFLVLAILATAMVRKAITNVPQNMAYVIERLGKYYATIGTGRYLLFPFVNNIAYRHTLQDQLVVVPGISAISRDNISLLIEGELCLKVIDPFSASYCVDNYIRATTDLAQAIIRDEIGKIELDKSIEIREYLDTRVIPAINAAAVQWGVHAMHYDLKNIVKEE